ncbi:RHS repeat domain-containing protein [Apibacter adventoris]|uniref:RHS repeat domain-containing protein n=1 Tax=Apibacter adventoris TaxID=1679466 RepID=UPI001C86857C|nr:RHS repeat-associated core domain-containing protein [Apibacter adventoris]
MFIEERNQSWNTPYLFNGKELDEETGLYYYGARYYNPRESVWLSTDPLAEKYPNVSPYAYVSNNPVNAIDPDGKRIYFVAGAGNDVDGWNYVNRFNKIWTSLGLKNFRRVNVSHGKTGDINFVNKYRNKRSFWTHGEFSGPNEHRASDDKQYQRALKGIINDLKKNPLPEGEQLNLAGYSYGAVMQAQLAIGLVEKGYKVDNLILIGSPTSDNNDLMKTLKGYEAEGKIGKIIRHDIKGDYLSNPKNEWEFIKGGAQSLQGIGEGDDAPHFDLARPGKEADSKIEKLGKTLQNNGVE